MCQVSDIYIVDTMNTNPYLNLAIEEYLCEHFEEKTAILYLWQNANTVVIGQNQSAYSQCNISQIEKAGAHIARRRSGGGAVYHDLGNLNYTFISQNRENVCDDNFHIILQMLKSVGIEAEFSGRNDILVAGKKISGNAFLCDDRMMCQHGTLLVDTNQNEMYRLLRIDDEKWKDKGIMSAQSRTANIVDFLPDISVDILKQRLTDEFCAFYPNAKIHDELDENNSYFNQEELIRLTQKYGSDEWIFEKRFEESMHLQNKFAWGQIDISFLIQKNMIMDAIFLSDAMDTALISEMNRRIRKIPFKRENVLAIFSTLETQYRSTSILNDIKNMIIEEIPGNKR